VSMKSGFDREFPLRRFSDDLCSRIQPLWVGFLGSIEVCRHTKPLVTLSRVTVVGTGTGSTVLPTR